MVGLALDHDTSAFSLLHCRAGLLSVMLSLSQTLHIDGVVPYCALLSKHTSGNTRFFPFLFPPFDFHAHSFVCCRNVRGISTTSKKTHATQPCQFSYKRHPLDSFQNRWTTTALPP